MTTAKRDSSRALRLPKLLRRLPENHFGVILADPPWQFKSYAKSANPDSDRHVERHYPTMSLEEIKALPVSQFASPDGCHLFLCATGPCLPQALEVMKCWNFRYSGIGFTWAKLKRSHDPHQLRVLPTIGDDFHTGLGFTTRKNCEFVLLGRRGNARRNSKSVRELIIAPVREHSRKPEELYERILLYADGPYLELFGRQQRPGWTVRGNEVKKFNAS